VGDYVAGIKRLVGHSLATGIAVFLLSFFLAVGGASAGEWVPFDKLVTLGAESRAMQLEVPVSSENEVILDLDFPGMNVTRTIQDGVTYHNLFIADGGQSTDVGQPALPFVGRYVAVPHGARIDVAVIDSAFREIEGYTVAPAQPPLTDGSGKNADKDRPFERDAATYQKDLFLPQQIVQIETLKVIRGCRAAILRVYPVQFNPTQKTLRVYSHVRVKMTFKGGTGKFIQDRLRSPAFDRTFKRMFLNNPMRLDQKKTSALPTDDQPVDQTEAQTTESPNDLSENGVPVESTSTDGNALLVITHPNFLDAANTLKAWKIKKGIVTEVRTTTDTGSTAAAIQSYIQNAYDTWTNPPTYVLLIGDADFIPCHYETPHPYHGGLTGTDLYYATVDGTDYFPDISLGRLSVDTAAQAAKRVNDIIAYEQSPVMDSSFYQNATICAYFQDYNDYNDIADRRFAQTSEDLAIFFSDAGYLGDYSVDRIYYTEPNVDPQSWGTDPWIFGGGPAGDPGDPIPSYLEKPGFAWDGDAADISAAVNAGRFLVTHRDHGLKTGWGDPAYSVSNVQALTNGDKLPVVWSLNCETGWFDDETDGSYSNSLCFTEAWERNTNGGAVGIIGATRVSYSGHNDRLCWGWTDAIWPDFIPTYSLSGTPFDDPVYEMGPVLNYGKYYYATMFSDDIYRLCEFEIFHWFGDPTMQIWTGVPQNLTVSHPADIDDGANAIAVTVDQADALICVSHNNIILGKTVSTGEIDTVSWETALGVDDVIDIIVTKHNFRPYVGMATVVGTTPGVTLDLSTPAEATEGDGVLTGQGTISISGTLTEDLVVTLSSSDTTEITVPAQATITAGQLSVNFDITVIDDALADGTQAVIITAITANKSATAVMNVHDNEAAVLFVTIPASVIEGDGLLAGQGIISVNRSVGEDITVTLASDDITEVTVPSSVTIPVDQTSVTFNLTVQDDGDCDGTQTATITASATGMTSGTDTINVADNDVHHFGVSTITSPQYVGTPFSVTLTAYDVDSEVVPFAGTANLSASGDGGSVTIDPTTTGAFSDGLWMGDITANDADTGVVFSVGDGNGHTGTSNQFDVEINNGIPGTQKWAFPTGSVVSSSPAIDEDGTIYVGSDNLYAIHPDGSQKWAFGTTSGISLSSPAIGTDGTIYVGSNDGKIYAVNPDGSQKWAFATSGSGFTRSSPAIGSDGTIYVGGMYSRKLYAINPDGTQKWAFVTGNTVESSPAIGSDGTIYVGCYDSNLYAINPDGTQKWLFGTDGAIRYSPAIGSDGTIYIGCDDHYLYAVNPDGTQKWAFEASPGYIANSPVIGADGTIYAGTIYLYAINPDGSQKWVWYKGSLVMKSTPAIGQDGTIYVGASEGNVYSVNSDGTKKWLFATGGNVNSSPAIGADGTIYIGSDDGNVYAINGESGGLADTPWPMFHQNLHHTGRQPSPAGTVNYAPNLVNWNGNMVADFGDNGMWYHDGSSWHWMTNRGHVNQMVVWDGKLVVDFGSDYGLHCYDDTGWTWMSNKGDVAKMIAWNNGATEKLVVDFGAGRRVYTYNGSWSWFTNKDAVANMTVWDNRLVVDFGSGRGVYNNDGAWHWMSNKDDITRMVVWNNGSTKRLVVDFGGGRRVYTYNGAWTWLTNKDDVNDMAVWNNKLVVDFGNGRRMYTYDGAWSWITNKADVARMVAWNDGADKLAVDFGAGRGMYYYDGTWNWMKNADTVPEMIAWGERLAVDFGSGVGIYNYDGSWNFMKSWSTAD